MANTPVTINRAKVSAMPLPEQSAGFTRKFHVDYTDVNLGTGASDTVTMTLGSTPGSNWLITDALVQVTTAFAGTTAFTIQVGTTTSSNAILASSSTLSAGPLLNTNGAHSVNTVGSCFGTTSTSLTATFTNATGGSPSALSAGALDIFIALWDPTKLDGPLNNA